MVINFLSLPYYIIFYNKVQDFYIQNCPGAWCTGASCSLAAKGVGSLVVVSELGNDIPEVPVAV